MRTLLVAITTLVLALALPAALYAQEPDPAAVVIADAEAFNAGDINATMAFWADDAVAIIVPATPGTPGTYTGLEEIRAWLEGMVAANGQLEVETVQVDGNTVTSKVRYWDDNVSALGMEYLEATEEYTIQEGKIIAYTWTYTDECWAELEAAFAALALPETGMRPPPAEMLPLWLAVGGLLLLASGGLWRWTHSRE